MKCALCDAPESSSWLYFSGKGKMPNKGKVRVRGQIPLCDHHSEQFFKHMKRFFAASLFQVGLLLIVLIAPASTAAQSAADSLRAQVDSLRADQIRQRAFNRSAETTGTRAISRTDEVLSLVARLFGGETEPPGPPVVLDWRTGEWDVLAGGYRVVLNLDRGTVSTEGVTAPVTVQAVGDTLRVRLAVPGLEAGLVEMVHAEGRMIGTVDFDGQVRPASGQRLELLVVETVQQGACTFAQYTDGSWGVAPHNAACHQSLDAYLPSRLVYVAREYTP